MGEVALFLSPHLDDVVLSCPVFIQRLVRAGCRVIVATVFSEGAADLYRERRAEDCRAVELLGAEAVHLGYSDAPFRSARYCDFCSIGFGREPEYDATLEQVSARFAGFAADLVVAPMAAGNHVDHRLTRDAALAAVDRRSLRFYEDRPYAFVREQVGHVLGRSMAQLPEAFWDRYFETAYVRAYLGETPREDVIENFKRVPQFPGTLFVDQTIEPAPEEAARAAAAVRAYGTQVWDLFSDESELADRYAKTAETVYRL